jgi:hypothetical protein
MPDPFPLTSLADLADGVTVVPFHSKHAQWVRVGERYADACVIHRQSFSGGSVMVWGSITAHGRTPLVVIAGNTGFICKQDVDPILYYES